MGLERLPQDVELAAGLLLDLGHAMSRATRGDVAARLARGIPGTLSAVDHAAGLLRLAAGRTGKARDLLGAAHAA